MNAIDDARKYIVAEEYDEANKIVYDTMQQTIHEKIFNEKSIELLPAYFILAEANIGMGGAKLKKAEEFLIAANWNLLKSGSNEDQRGAGDETLVTKEDLKRYTAALNITFGRLFMAQNRPKAHEKALEKLTRGIYMECQEHGPESIYLCRSYFFMGQLFMQAGEANNAKAFYQKIVQIVKNFIIDIKFTTHGEDYQVPHLAPIVFDEAEKNMLMILQWYRQEFGAYDNATAECQFAVSLVACMREQWNEALEGMRSALQDYQNNLSAYDRKTREVEQVIQQIEAYLMHNNQQ